MKKETPKTDKFLLVTCVDKDHIFQHNDIICIGAESSQVCIYTHLQSAHPLKVVVCKKLKEMEELLPSEKFFRSHHSWLVNLKYVIEHTKVGSHSLLLTQGLRVPLSRAHKEGLLPALERFALTN